MKLSRRMKAVASMVTTGGILADIGTDHGSLIVGAKILAIIIRPIRVWRPHCASGFCFSAQYTLKRIA